MKKLVFYLAPILIGLIFSGCRHTIELTSDSMPEQETDVEYSVTYYIHADADYLYHAPDGSPIRENAGVLTTAKNVARNARSGEVFIYHQRSEKKLLGLFPRRNSRLFHYKNGRLINRVNYRHPDMQEAFLATEVQLLNKYQTQNPTDNHQNYFLFFGHEIPSKNGRGYHNTLPEIEVNAASFARGIQNFLLTDEDRFDLVVLSACNSGTPKMAELLIPFTDMMLASPQNLHLSHIDSDSMSRLESVPGISPIQIGRSMANQTFQRLETTVHTTITLALYDFSYIQPYIKTLASMTAAHSESNPSVPFSENVDCAQIPNFKSEFYQQGVETWFKPAKFGRQSNRQTHSGWGCKPELKQ